MTFQRTANTSNTYRVSELLSTHRLLAFMLFVISALNSGHALLLTPANSSTAIDLQMLSTSIATDGSGNTYYVDTAHGIVYKDSLDGVQTQISCCNGLSQSSLSNPRGVALDGNGDLYIADTGNNRIVEISSISTISTVSTPLYQLSRPSGIALDAEGDLYIADSGNNRILEVAVGGQSTLVGTASYQLSNPQSVSVDKQNILYIADSGNNRLISISASGSTAVLFANQLSAPLSIASDTSGNAYIAETGAAIDLSQQSPTGGAEIPSVVTSFSATNINIAQGNGSEAAIGSINITLTPQGGFNNTLYLSVLGLPPNTVMQLTNPIVTLSGNSPVIEGLQVEESQNTQSGYLIKSGPSSRYPRKLRSTIVLAGIAPISLLFLVGLRMTGKHSRIMASIIGALTLFILLPAIALVTSGCKGGYPAGLFGSSTYTATLVARAANGNTVNQLGSFGITLQ